MNKDRDTGIGYDEICPKCNSRNINRETEGDYTGGGYSESWDSYECQNCGYTWQGEKSLDYS